MLSDYSRIGSVDAIMATACLVHIESKDLSTAFRRMSTVLKSGGLVPLSIGFGNGKIDVQSFRTVDGEEFDHNFIGHTIDEILAASGQWFEYVTELETDMPIWEYHIIRKNEGQLFTLSLFCCFRLYVRFFYSYLWKNS